MSKSKRKPMMLICKLYSGTHQMYKNNNWSLNGKDGKSEVGWCVDLYFSSKLRWILVYGGKKWRVR